MNADVDAAREALLALLNSLGIVGPNIIHVEQGMYPDGKQSADDTWDGPGWCVCGRRWPCEALATIAAADALIAAIRAECETAEGRLLDEALSTLRAGTLRIRAAALDEARAAVEAERDKASASGRWTRHGLMMALAAIDALREDADKV